MAITFTLTEEEYQMLIQMLVNSNPIIQKIAQQANPQIQAAQAAKPAEVKTPEVVKPAPFGEQRERNR